MFLCLGHLRYLVSGGPRIEILDYSVHGVNAVVNLKIL